MLAEIGGKSPIAVHFVKRTHHLVFFKKEAEMREERCGCTQISNVPDEDGTKSHHEKPHVVGSGR